MEEIKKLKSKRRTFMQQLTLFGKHISKLQAKLEINDQEIDELKARIDRIKIVYSQFDEVQIQLEMLEEESHLEYREEFDNTYFSLLAKATKLSATNQIRTEVNQTKPNIDSSHVKLPTIDLPSFNGDFTLWTQFKDTFTALIHQNQNLSDVQKLCYLRASLMGEALNIIQSLETTNQNYQIAFELIKERYDYKRKIIYSHVQRILNIEKQSSLHKLINIIENHVNCLKSLGVEVEKWDAILIPLILTKLEKHTIRDWELRVNSTLTKDTLPTFAHLVKFLIERADTLDSLHTNHTQHYKPKVLRNTFVTTSSINCPKCQAEHSLYACPSFLACPIQERIHFVTQQKMCINCLGKNHKWRQCKSNSKCKQCNRTHNTLLHIVSKDRNNTNNLQNESEPSTSNKNNSNDQPSAILSPTSTNCSLKLNSNTITLLSTAKVIVFDKYNKPHTARALLDSASQSNYITEKLRKKLELPVHDTNIFVTGINQKLSRIQHCTSVNIKSCYSDYNIKLSCLILPKISDNLPHAYFNTEGLNIPSNLNLADNQFNEPSEVDMLIGSTEFWNVICDGRISLGNYLPSLRNTKLGWVVFGQLPVVKKQSNIASYFSTEDKLENTLQKLWQVDQFLDTTCQLSNDERLCEDNFKQTVSRTEDGRFVVTIPIKPNHKEIGKTMQSAIKKFYSIEKQFEKNPSFKEQYCKFMNEYIDLGHMTPISNIRNYKPPVNNLEFFMPHQAVIRDSITTKMRVVFNASSKSSSGISLNDIQLTGPTIQSDLFSILTRFRVYKFVVTADIEKMYRQILVTKNQRPLQQIVWRGDPSQSLDIYQLNTVTYGTSSAPFLAIRCLVELANLHSETHPEESEIIKNDFYVDDFITGANDVQSLLKTCNNVDKILRSGGFVLRKWHSNIHLALQHGGEAGDNDITQFSLDDTKTLGLKWDPKSDTFLFQFNIYKIPQKITKRCIVSSAAQLFDPLGLLTPITVIPKIIIQKLWKESLGWDDIIPETIQNQWLLYQNELEAIKHLKINRTVLLPNAIYELHGFADASERAYGACVYLVSTKENSEITSNLLTSKSRVAPIKQLTIPRLELCAAVLLTQLMNKVKNILKINIKTVYLYSDSTIALAWIKSQSSKWQTFVANRVAEIQRNTNTDDWYHVRSEDNPADIISRGCISSELIKHTLWWQGPQWLGRIIPQKYNPSTLKDIPEIKLSSLTFAPICNNFNLFEKYSNLNTLINVVAYCKRFIHNCRNPNEKLLGIIRISERNASLNNLIQLCQTEAYSHEIQSLKRNLEINKQSSILSLNPFLDDSQILRVGGRLKNANVPYDQRHQIILPSSHTLTRLITEREHKINLHCGTQSLLYALRRKYWPLSGRNLTRKVVHNCLTCFKQNAKPLNQIMGNLPASRVNTSQPFNTCGIDYAGPFSTLEKRSRGVRSHKAYVCLFICFFTKAIHLELVSDLTSQAFIAAFRRFVARRGKPTTVISDNATNFVGANSEIKRMAKLLPDNLESINNSLTKTGVDVDWQFIPARSPHFGGLWESHIKIVKRNLVRIIGSSRLTFEEFATVLTQIEAVVNSRPISPLSSDSSDLSPLTPSHFLIGGAHVTLPDEDISSQKDNLLSHYQRLQKITQQFWNRWRREYISHMQQRSKWKNPKQNVQVGVLVLLVDDNLPPFYWRMGRIAEVHRGSDDKARVVTVKTQNGVTKRAITKICALPIDIVSSK